MASLSPQLPDPRLVNERLPNELQLERRRQLRAIVPLPAPPAALPRRRRRRLEGYRPALLVAALAAALIALTWLAPLEAINASNQATDWLERHADVTGQAVATIALAAIGLLAIVGAWARATSWRRPVRLPAGGRIEVAEIERRLAGLLEERPDIVRAEVRVDNLHRRGLRLATRLHVAPDANLTSAIHAVSEAAELLLHGRLLVRLSSPPSVELKFDELDLRAGRVNGRRTHAAGG